MTKPKANRGQGNIADKDKGKDAGVQEIITPEQWKAMTTKDALAYWLAIPSKTRTPSKQKDLAEILGVSQERLCQIKNEDGFYEQVNEYRKTFFRQFTSNIINSIRKSAEMGDHKAAKLFLQYIEDFKEISRQEVEKTERKEFVFVLGADKWAELQKQLKDSIEMRELTFLKHQKIEPEEGDEGEEAEEAEVCEDMQKDKT